jgi:2'-5' RNA ligase
VVEEVGRVFVAVDPTEEARHRLAAALAEWNRGQPLPGRPVPPGNWHLTLRFLGSVETWVYERFLSELERAALGPSFRISVEGIGAFPGPRRARVLWVGVGEGRQRLVSLATATEQAAVAAGLQPEERPFRPHLTLSRLRPDQDVTSLVEREPPSPIRFQVEELVVYRSILGRGGARYEALERLPLT